MLIFIPSAQRAFSRMSGLVKSLLGMGNPLLDIMAEVDQATLDKYKVDALHCSGSLQWPSRAL